METSDHFQEPVLGHARRDFCSLIESLTVEGALATIRKHGLGERILYFYVVDAESRLVGVLPTRRLLTAPLTQRISTLMVTRVVAIPQTATVMEACECFVLHKFLAFPVVDEQRRVVGVVDVSLLTGEMFDFEERERVDTAFETIGIRLSQVRGATPWLAFRYRFPWLLATVGSGTVCALLASQHETTLAKSLVLAFFLTMVLGLGESVSVQTMAVTIQGLRASKPSWKSFGKGLRKELATACLLGLGCALVVGIIVWVWRGAALPAVVIGASVGLALVAASASGISVPTALHALRLDPKIAAGPITLALSDVLTLLIYFNLARSWL